MTTMNEQQQAAARQALKDELVKLPAHLHRMFKIGFGRPIHPALGTRRSLEEAEAMSLDEVVNQIPLEKLDQATRALQETLDKLARQAVEKTDEQ